jgi:hypothetical protein
MPSNAFVSYDNRDAQQIAGFRLLKNNPKHPLDFHDQSLKEPVRDTSGGSITHPPSDARSKPVRDEIIEKFERASKLVVLIGDQTHRSEWVDWEIKTFFEMKRGGSGENTWKRIRGMRLKGAEGAQVPAALLNRSEVMEWDPEALERWVDLDPDA